MSFLPALYRHSLALLTDLYQLTMAYGYWKEGMAEREAVFHLFFRRPPFGGGFTLACGLAQATELVEGLRFTEDDRAYLASLQGVDGRPLFEPAFLDYLADLRPRVDIDAVPEGTVVFPHEPLVRVKGPILHCQLLETPLLTLVNFQSLIATKAARICLATQGDPVLEFGLRRAQGIDGGLSASRAAYVGGAAATSNVLAGKLFGIPVKGTHAHSWVMAFDDEPEAFAAWARAMPNNAVFLVDTYDTLEGVRRAVEAGRRLAAEGHRMLGVRLDSGDLAYLSIEARKILDEAGFEDAKIFASSDLDEHVIESLKAQGAKIGVWGVGTKLATAYDQPALGGVYKLAAIREEAPSGAGRPEGGEWEYRVKLSERAVKTSNPGIQQVRRFSSASEYVADAIYDEGLGIGAEPTIVDAMDMTRRKNLTRDLTWEDLLRPVFRGGERVEPSPAAAEALEEARDRAQRQLGHFHGGVKRFLYPHSYPVGLEEGLFDLKTRLVMEARANG